VPSALSLSATPIAQDVGRTVTLLASHTGPPGTLVRFQVMKGPDTGFTAIIAADQTGSAATVLTGKAAGVDSVVAWLDSNMNGSLDTGEPSATTTVTWTKVPTAPPAKGSGATYVAVGDSYSSGEGLPPYFLETDVSCLGPGALACKLTGIQNGNQCHRSMRSYPEFVLQGSGAPTRTFRACSGAVMDDFLHSRGFDQLPNTDDGHLYDPAEPAQAVWLGPQAKYVTLSISGNDAGFVDILEKCEFTRAFRLISKDFLPSQSFINDCDAKMDKFTAMLPTIGSSLRGIYRLVLSRAPNAKIRVLNYPTLFPDPDVYTGYKNEACEISQLGAYVLDQHVRRFRELNAAINATIAQAVNAVHSGSSDGARIELADVQALFGDHTISCGDTGRPAPWINATLLRPSNPSNKFSKAVSTASFHPNATGQCEIAILVDMEFDWKGPARQC
jgi:hypothetical protein